MGVSDYGQGTNCIRYTFIGFNVFGIVLSILGFIIGIWSIASPQDNDYADLAGTDRAVSSGVILLISSIVLFGLCIAGCVGAFFMWPLFLIIYAIVLSILVLLEFISAILAFAFADNVGETIERNMKNYIRDYRTNETFPGYRSSVNDVVDTVQKDLTCCGVNGPNDWLKYNPEAVKNNSGVPPGNCICDQGSDCMDNFNGTGRGVWADGCLKELEEGFRGYGIGAGIVSLMIMFIEIAFVCTAIGLTVTIRRTRGKRTVI